MIVVDASVLLEVLLRTPRARRLEARLFAPGESLHAPHLVDVEVVQVLRRFASQGAITTQRAADALADLFDFPLARYPHETLLPRAWDWRHNLTIYDAVYVALAEALPAPLVTCDAKLAAAPGMRARVEVV